MPDEVRPRNLFIEACRGLKDDGVRENDNAARGLNVIAAAAHLHQMNANEADVEHIARDSGDLHAIADANAVASDQEEVAGDRQDYILQGDCYAGGDQPCERRQ